MIRLLLVLACLVFFVLCLAGMRVGWRHRAGRQGGVGGRPVPPVDAGPPLLAPLTGLYVGTTRADEWQNRIAAADLGARAESTATLTGQGLLIDRNGAEPIFIPAPALVGVGVGAGLAGKVVGPGGLLVVRWRDDGGNELDTGLRGDDKSVYPDWIEAIDGLVDGSAKSTTEPFTEPGRTA